VHDTDKINSVMLTRFVFRESVIWNLWNADYPGHGCSCSFAGFHTEFWNITCK